MVYGYILKNYWKNDDKMDNIKQKKAANFTYFYLGNF